MSTRLQAEQARLLDMKRERDEALEREAELRDKAKAYLDAGDEAHRLANAPLGSPEYEAFREAEDRESDAYHALREALALAEEE